MEVTSMEVTSMEVTSNKLGKQCTHVILCMIDYCFVKLRLTCFVAHHALCLGKCNGCCHRCYGKQRNPMSRYIVLHTHRLVVFRYSLIDLCFFGIHFEYNSERTVSEARTRYFECTYLLC